MDMRGVIFHDYFDSIGGGEKTALAIAQSLNADIITTSVTIPLTFFQGVKVHTLTIPPPIPGVKQISAAFVFWLGGRMNSYDYAVFSGNWAHYASNIDIPSVYYCQDAPVRALYDLYSTFKQNLPWYQRLLYTPWAGIMRRGDQRAIKKVTCIIANSKQVQERVNRYYHRKSRVIYPPINTTQYTFQEYGDFWLSVNRLYPEKRIDLQIETFRQLPQEKLIIVGGFSPGDHAAPYAREMIQRAKKYPNITILHQGISDEELRDLYSRCTGLICTSHQEAFGMAPIEAMASGKPVIAVSEGGFLETVTAECGMFIKPNASDLIQAIQTVSVEPKRYYNACIERSARFGSDRFSREIQSVILELTSMKP